MENKDWNYIGLFLDDSTKEELRNYIIKSKYGNLFSISKREYIDHCTLLHKSRKNDEIENFCNRCQGLNFYISITSIGLSDKTMAFGVNLHGIPCNNAMPHITICTFSGGKPVDSNSITRWEELDEPLTIQATLKFSK